MAADPNFYEVPWRPNVEMTSAYSWGAASISSLALSLLSPQPSLGIGPAALCMLVGGYRTFQAIKRESDSDRLKIDGRLFITAKDLIEIAKVHAAKGQYWMGKGFEWTDIEATRLHHILDEGPKKVLGKLALHPEGAHWIQGLAAEMDLASELANKVGHTVVSGTTRVGKTRYLEIDAVGAVVRGEAVFVFDPKNEGMAGVAGNLKRVCELLGCPERFVYFNMAFPDESVRIDPLKNYSNPTELASRLAPLVPSEDGNDPFTSFAWEVLNGQTMGMLYINEKPSLKRYRFYTENGVSTLLLRVLLKFLDESAGDDWETEALLWAKSKGGVKGKQGDDGEILVRESLGLLLAFYFDVMVPRGLEEEAINALSVIYKHPAEHSAKMLANLRPVLTKLTTGALGGLLSPDPLDVSDKRVMTDIQSLVNSKAVVYIGLNSLADGAIGSAIGSIISAELAAVAGARNNYAPKDKSPINAHFDESVEVLNNSVIQLMNKGGGSGFQVTIYTQTFADFEARLGSAAKARQVLANANNRISFRVLDKETQEYIVDGTPQFKKRSIGVRYGHNVDTKIADEYTASYQEQIALEDADMFPAAMLGELAPLHFIARMSGGRMRKGRIPILQG